MRRAIIIIAIMLLLMPAAHAGEKTQIPVNDAGSLKASFENITILNVEKAPKATYTTQTDYSFGYDNAKRITYMNGEGKLDWVIVWQCRFFDFYKEPNELFDAGRSFCDIAKDNKSVVYAEESPREETVYGIILDTQNVSYTCDELLYDILGFERPEVQNDTNISMPISYSYTPERSHYNGPVIDPYELARDDPWAYYDHFDYEDNVDIDEYLYDEGYDE